MYKKDGLARYRKASKRIFAYTNMAEGSSEHHSLQRRGTELPDSDPAPER